VQPVEKLRKTFGKWLGEYEVGKISPAQTVATKFRNDKADIADQAPTGLDLKKLIIDHEASIEDVFTSLINAVVSATGSLNILRASQYPSSFSSPG
jgi:hypothetical protein